MTLKKKRKKPSADDPDRLSPVERLLSTRPTRLDFELPSAARPHKLRHKRKREKSFRKATAVIEPREEERVRSKIPHLSQSAMK